MRLPPRLDFRKMKRYRTPQPEIERYYFEMFRKVYALPDGSVRYGDKPDVTIGGTKLGIEITNFYVEDGSSPASEQVQYRHRIESVSKAQRIYEQATGKNFQLSFSFNKDNPILNPPALVKQLVELARRVEGWENSSIKRSVFRDIPELEFVYLYAQELVYPPYNDPEFPNGQPDIAEGTLWAEYRNRREAFARRAGIYKPLSFTAVWLVSQGHDFGIMSQARLIEIIKEKEKKATGYMPCDAYWLLVVVDSSSPAQEQEIRRDEDLNVSSNVFQKIIVYKPIFEHIVETP
jgi:hypothetical protein